MSPPGDFTLFLALAVDSLEQVLRGIRPRGPRCARPYRLLTTLGRVLTHASSIAHAVLNDR